MAEMIQILHLYYFAILQKIAFQYWNFLNTKSWAIQIYPNIAMYWPLGSLSNPWFILNYNEIGKWTKLGTI